MTYACNHVIVLVSQQCCSLASIEDQDMNIVYCKQVMVVHIL